MEPKTIEVHHAREHNLRSVSVSLPRNSLIVFTGVSGSGKSSLAFDTLYAEGQRRYIESLSSYARQFMGQMKKPDCDQITGLSPAISIQQKTTGWNPRSTVGTVTAIYDFLRVLYARVGTQHCSQCGKPISAQSREQIVAGVFAAFAAEAAETPKRRNAETSKAEIRSREGIPAMGVRDLGHSFVASRAGGILAPAVRVMVLAPVARGQKGEFRDLFEDLIRAGYARARVDGRVVELREDSALNKNQRHDIEVVIDRLVLEPGQRTRLAEAVENALRVGKGTLIVATMAEKDEKDAAGVRPGRGRRGSDERVFSSKYACTECGISFEPPSPQLFSFNSPSGMCTTCDGLGEVFDFDPDLLVPDARLNFFAPCVAPMRTKIGRWRRHIFEGVAKAVGFDVHRPWRDLPKAAREALLYGTGDRHITYEWRWSGGVWKHGGKFEGVLVELRDKYRKAKGGIVRAYYEKYMRRTPCANCAGARLNPQAAGVRLAVDNGGRAAARMRGSSPTRGDATGSGRPSPTRGDATDRGEVAGPNIHELCDMSIADCRAAMDRLVLTPVQQVVAEEVLKEVRSRLDFLINVGLHYLTLNRSAPTLSGGESQRIRLAGQIGAGLVGVLYILDEPSIGLHPRDNLQLLESLIALRDMGNTVIVVEHDEATMRAADYVVDFGPGPGVRGGEIVAAGSYQEVLKNKRSLTGKYLTGEEKIEVPKKRRPVSHQIPESVKPEKIVVIEVPKGGE